MYIRVLRRTGCVQTRRNSSRKTGNGSRWEACPDGTVCGTCVRINHGQYRDWHRLTSKPHRWRSAVCRIGPMLVGQASRQTNEGTNLSHKPPEGVERHDTERYRRTRTATRSCRTRKRTIISVSPIFCDNVDMLAHHYSMPDLYVRGPCRQSWTSMSLLLHAIAAWLCIERRHTARIHHVHYDENDLVQNPKFQLIWLSVTAGPFFQQASKFQDFLQNLSFEDTLNYWVHNHFYRAMHFSANARANARSWDRMSSVCPSVRPSVTLVICDHICWISWKLIARTISPTPSLFVAKRRSTYSQGNMGKFWGN